jgi:Zn-dependent protease with chaperone function
MVTEAPVICLDGTLKGRTLFLSLPFCRVLTKKELAAIIGHELGHFVGMDTKFSRWFFPIYRGASETSQTLAANVGGKDNGLQSVALLPPLFLMSFFMSSFARAENEISRERELAADKLGALIAGQDSMASGLVKVHAYSQVWAYTRGKMKEALQEGKQLTNASAFFAAIVSAVPKDVFKEDLGQSRTPHPTDSHPLLVTRMISLGAELQKYTDIALVPVEDAQKAIGLIDGYEKVECELSDLEHYKLMNTGAVKLKPDPAEASTEKSQSQESKTA